MFVPYWLVGLILFLGFLVIDKKDDGDDDDDWDDGV